MGHADYTQNTGSGGIMLIRVADAAGTPGVINGNDIQFHIQAGLSATWVGSPGFHWNYYINGAWGNDTNQYIGNYSNREWRHVATFNITTTQDVCFHINNSGTQGFGGPTDFWLRVNRASPPAAPTPLGIDQIAHQTFRYRFSGNSDGGAPIREWQIGYGYNPSTPDYTAPSNGTITVGTFIPGATIYIWSRGRNDAGWGAWSTRSQVTLLRGCMVKVKGVWTHAIPYVKVSGEWKPAEPYIKVSGAWQKAAYAG